MYLCVASKDLAIFLPDNAVSSAKNRQGADGLKEARGFSKGCTFAFLLTKHGLAQAPAQFMDLLPTIFEALLRGMAGQDLTESGQSELALMDNAGKGELQRGQRMVCGEAELVKQGGGIAQYSLVGLDGAAGNCQPVHNRSCQPVAEIV
jgi:hypothetical protein